MSTGYVINPIKYSDTVSGGGPTAGGLAGLNQQQVSLLQYINKYVLAAENRSAMQEHLLPCCILCVVQYMLNTQGLC
jgi:hypothetical protein